MVVLTRNPMALYLIKVATLLRSWTYLLHRRTGSVSLSLKELDLDAPQENGSLNRITTQEVKEKGRTTRVLPLFLFTMLLCGPTHTIPLLSST